MAKKICSVLLMVVLFFFVGSNCYAKLERICITINQNGSVLYEEKQPRYYDHMKGKDLSFLSGSYEKDKNIIRSNAVENIKIEPYHEEGEGGDRVIAKYSAIESFLQMFSQRWQGSRVTHNVVKGGAFDTYSINIGKNEEMKKIFMDSYYDIKKTRPEFTLEDYKILWNSNATEMRLNFRLPKEYICFKLPYGAESHNAEEKDNDNKILYWDHTNSVLTTGMNDISLKFKIWHKAFMIPAPTITINPTGNVIYEVILPQGDLPKDLYEKQKNDYINIMRVNATEEPTVEAYDAGVVTGVKITAKYKSVGKFSEMLSGSNVKAEIKKVKGWLFDSYSMEFTFDFKDLAKAIKEHPESANEIREMLSKERPRFTVKLPYGAGSNNANELQDEKQKLLWDLAAMPFNADSSAKVQYKSWHKNHVITAAVVIGVLLLISIILAIMAFTLSGSTGKMVSGILAGILFIIALVLGGMALYTMSSTPHFTENSVIGKENGSQNAAETKKEASKPSSSALDNANLTKAQKELNQKGVPGNVLATTLGHNPNGYLSLMTNNGMNIIVVNDLKNGRIGVITDTKEILPFSNKGSKAGKDEFVKFVVNVLNDTKDKDSQSGIWDGNNHVMPVHATYKVDSSGNVTPGMLLTGAGDSVGPSISLKDYFNEQRNVDTIICV